MLSIRVFDLVEGYIWIRIQQSSSFLSIRVFNLNTQVERNEIELEFNKVDLSFQLCWKEFNWTCWMKKFHAVKFNLNEEISYSEIQLIFAYSTVQFYSTKSKDEQLKPNK